MLRWCWGAQACNGALMSGTRSFAQAKVLWEQMLQVTLFIGNLTQEWQDDGTLHTELSKHGRLERLFIAKTANGSHKVRLLPVPASNRSPHLCRG